MTTQLFLATRNSDLTEGRGHTLVFGIFTEAAPAVEAVKGQGVMGVQDGSVYTVEVDTTYDRGMFARENLVYGYRQDRAGNWGYGYALDSEYEPEPDPEYLEYLRLHEKWGNR